MRFISNDEILKWCRGCQFFKMRESYNDKIYGYCDWYSMPVFKAMEKCKTNINKTNQHNQKILSDFGM